MEIRKIVKIGLRWWWLALLPVIVVGGYLALTYSAPAPVYQVVMRFTAGSEPVAPSEDYDRYYTWLTSEYIANGLADVARTGTFAQAVSARLAAQGIEVAPGAVQGALISDNAQSVLVIYLTWADPAQIVPLADAVSAELAEGGAAYYPQLTGLANPVKRVDAPVAVPLAASLRAQLLGPALKLALAAAVGLGLILLAHYLDPMVREQSDVETAGVPVLVALPRRRK